MTLLYHLRQLDQCDQQQDEEYTSPSGSSRLCQSLRCACRLCSQAALSPGRNHSTTKTVTAAIRACSQTGILFITYSKEVPIID
jgi:hypothetical protein